MLQPMLQSPAVLMQDIEKSLQTWFYTEWCICSFLHLLSLRPTEGDPDAEKTKLNTVCTAEKEVSLQSTLCLCWDETNVPFLRPCPYSSAQNVLFFREHIIDKTDLSVSLFRVMYAGGNLSRRSFICQNNTAWQRFLRSAVWNVKTMLCLLWRESVVELSC